MTVMGMVLSGILVLIALIAIAFPLIQQSNSNRENASNQLERDELLTNYERVLATIRDLDEDHQTGKLAPEAYQRERAYWTEQGILLLEKIDPETETETAPEPEPVSEVDKALDDAIEEAIAAYRKAEVKS